MADILTSAVAVLEAQTAKGVRKYGGTLDETRPSGPELLDHAIQEAADLLLYLVALSTPVRKFPCEAQGTRWRHRKTGHEYTIVGTCRLEHSNAPAYLYTRPEDGIVWARDMDEFLDGRFEMIHPGEGGEDGTT